MSKLAIVTLLAAGVSGCFKPSYESGHLQCGPQGQCPPGFDCISGRCYRPGEGPVGDGGIVDLAGADLTQPDLLIPDLLPVLYPPAAVWISGGGGSGAATSGAKVGLTCGGTSVSGMSTAVSSANATFGYFSNASIE